MSYFKNLDQTDTYSLLNQKANQSIHLKAFLSKERIQNYKATNGCLGFSYATSLVDNDILALFQKLADEQSVIKKYQQILAGDIMNVGENRKVLHHLARSRKKSLYEEELQKIIAFTKKVHSNALKGFTGKAFTDVVQIGIGGSDLGPRALYYALERYVLQKKRTLPLKASFIANVDPDDANLVLSKIDFETTLFIVVSKSGTTQETLTNLEFVQTKARAMGMKSSDFNKHFIAVTGKGSPMDDPSHYLASFYIDDYIGGRFSSTSAVGGAVLSLAFGSEIFESLLAGAKELDDAALNPNILSNISLLAALIGVWERTFLGFSSKAVIPYCEALCRFPAHLQQMDCESNGKSVNVRFEPISYQTGPMIFGEPGTNGQHSFFQKLHQGSDVIPVQFIGFLTPQIQADLVTFNSTSQTKLLANMIAQMAALALGKDDSNPNKAFSGNRPTSLIYAEQLTPHTLGALLAFYENVVMFQSFIWNINAFDQEGVQLGKLLTKEVLADGGPADPILAELMALVQK